jgi:plastocyanin
MTAAQSVQATSAAATATASAEAASASATAAAEAATQAASQPTPAPDQGGDQGQGGQQPPATLEVDMVDIAFNPKELTIPANTDVTINLVNSGAATHNFTLESQGITSGDYAGGQTGTLTLNLPPGDYEYVCTIPGHKEAGMVGILHVVEGGAAPSGGEQQAPPAQGQEQAPPPDRGAAAAPLEVDMVDIAFNPKELTIPANTDVTINLKNSGAATHNFNLEEQGIHSGDYASGQTGTLTINLPPGEYEYQCDIPGHKEAGMVGKLIVQ